MRENTPLLPGRSSVSGKGVAAQRLSRRHPGAPFQEHRDLKALIAIPNGVFDLAIRNGVIGGR
ncbi:hypothetical protein GE253_13895 [Niveispirillum sp. SYP-B3756]|uniref:hypothetical protein n=1 Tax=Niveispirillum sp. SYP-B3756 TaxID=2662178 RepID=UPI00135DB48D|nr:hypothetical protein [Niveispirillum sp. SYP-B3756]MQP66428.1 hypothetical protein [Niveispirillum sp. SYP-B3756]